MQAFQGYPVYLDEPWLIDVSHLLLVVAASCNVVIVAVQVGAKSRNDDGPWILPSHLIIAEDRILLLWHTWKLCAIYIDLQSTYIYLRKCQLNHSGRTVSKPSIVSHEAGSWAKIMQGKI